MISVDYSFHKLIEKYIPQFSIQDFERHDRLMTVRYHLQQEKNYVPRKFKKVPAKYHSLIKTKSQTISKSAGDIILEYDKLLKAIKKLWIARRQFALEQGHLLQIPTSLSGWINFTKAWINYRFVQIRTLPILWLNLMYYSVKSLTLSQLLFIIVLIACFLVVIFRIV